MLENVRKFLARVLTVAAVTTARGYSYNGLTWQDGFTVGGWGCAFQSAKAYAKEHNVPLVTVWANPGCGYCQRFESAVASSSVTKWAQDRKYILVFALGTVDDATHGMKAADVKAAKSFAYNSSGEFPYVCAWWPKDKSGREVLVRFSGRSGKMTISSGGLAAQFMDSVDQAVGAFADVAPKFATVTFNANGGSLKSSSSKTSSVVFDSPLASFPELNARSGYLPVGWWTAASGGEEVTTRTRITHDLTVYAHWAKAVKLTVLKSGDGAVSIDGEKMSSKIVPANGTVPLKATPKTGSVFSGWSTNNVVFSQNPTTEVALGTTALTVKAVFIAKTEDRVTVEATPAAEYARGEPIEPVQVRAAGTSVVRTLSASGLPAGLAFKNGVVFGTPTRSGFFTTKVKAVTAGGATMTVEVPFVVRAAGERIVRGACDAACGKTTGSGVYADGRKVSLRATAKTGWVFTGWTDADNAVVSRQPTLPLLVDGADLTYTACFVTREDDLASISLQLDGAELPFDVLVTNVIRQGVQVRWPVLAGAFSQTTVAVSGLPSGLKLQKTLVDKIEKTYDYEIVGTPTTASKTDARTGLVKPTVTKLKVTTSGRNTATAQIACVVEPLPAWAYGTFVGGSLADGEPNGLATLSLTAVGKLSGKVQRDGQAWTVTAPSFADFDYADETDEPVYFAKAVFKSGKLVETNLLCVVRQDLPDGSPVGRLAFVEDAEGGPLSAGLDVRQNLWKAEPWKTAAKAFAGKTVEAAPGVTLKTAATGVVTAAGRFVTGQDARGRDLVHSATCSTVLLPVGVDAYEVYVCFPPKAGKFAGYAARLKLVWQAERFAWSVGNGSL